MGLDEKTVVGDDGRELFSLDKANEGIRAVSDAMDGLDLTLSERFHVLKCLMAPYGALLGEKINDLAELWGAEGAQIEVKPAESDEEPAE